MRKKTKRVLGGLALAAGAVGAAGTFIGRKKKLKAKQQRVSENPASTWARPGMQVTFRAELMPGRDREERTARVKELLPSGRVTLDEHSGEHGQQEFEAIG